MKPHLFFYEGKWCVNLGGGRVWGWPFDSFERACLFARKCTPMAAVQTGLKTR